MDSKELFEKYLETLLSDLTRIDSYFELSIHIDNYRSNRLEVLNLAPTFFVFAMDSFYYSTIVSLARYYDSYKILNRSERNLIRFINYVEQNLDIFPSDRDTLKKLNIIHHVNSILIKEHRKLIQDVNPILDKLFTWRDKHFAHYDKKHFFNTEILENNYGLTINEIRTLILLAKKILNHYSIGYNGVANAVRASNLFDMDAVIEILHNHLYKR